MRLRVLALLSVSLLAASSLSVDAANVAAAKIKKVPPPPDYFPLRLDYWWKYKTEASTGESGFQVKVVGEEKKPDGTVIFDLHTSITSAVNTMGANGFDEWYVKPKGWVLSTKMKNGFNGQETEYAPPRKFLLNPLKVGETWTWEGTRAANVNATESNLVETIEDIEVPAGKFKAARVTTGIIQGGSPVTKTYWYAPWIGLVQSKTQSGSVASTTQLIDYSFKIPPKEDQAKHM